MKMNRFAVGLAVGAALLLAMGALVVHDPSWQDALKTGQVNQKIVETATAVYVAEAMPGTAVGAASWAIKVVYESPAGTTIVQWADGDNGFNNVATDPTALSYR